MMNRYELERITPEQAGIPSDAIIQLIDALKETGSEMHGLMILKSGKVASEMWWKPYAPYLRHTLHSLSKTYTATAIGLAWDEKLLDLNDSVLDFFLEARPDNITPNLKMLTIRHLLCMSCGMETEPSFSSGTWIKDFLTIPIVHTPGTVFRYNTAATTMLGAIIKKATGRDLHTYLNEKLFQKVGIDGENIKWFHMADGTPMGGGGMMATTEDNARLMLLYQQNGVWDEERILSEQWVEMATSAQIDCSLNMEGVRDCQVGYGFQIWRCIYPGAYRADGAQGQYSIVFPNEKLLVSITESAHYPDIVQDVLEAVYRILLPQVQSEPLPANSAANKVLAAKIDLLSISRPKCHWFSPVASRITGRRYQIIEGKYSLEVGGYLIPFDYTTQLISILSFEFKEGQCIFNFKNGIGKYQVKIGINGNRAENEMILNTPLTKLLLNGWWESDNHFILEVRWFESCILKYTHFVFEGDSILIDDERRNTGTLEATEFHAKAKFIGA